MVRATSIKYFILFLFTVSSLVQAQATGYRIAGRVVDENGAPLPGTHIEAQPDSGAATLATDAAGDGRFTIDNVPAGSYVVRLTLSGFQTISVQIPSLPAKPLEVVLPVEQNLEEAVTVTGEQEPLLLRDETERREKLDEKVLDYVPMASQRFQDALPLVPSVVRGPDGNINISGARASENSLLVNGANVTDPVTGNFAIDLPIEAVETVDVYTNPYSAQFGSFTGGITSISTRAGEDRFKVELNDFIPRVHFVDGWNTEGIEAWKPRIRFSGPTGKDHLYFSQAFQYQYLKTFFDDLPSEDEQNVTQVTAFDSLTQFDYIPNSRDQWSFTGSVFPENTDNVNLSKFLPAPSTPDFKQRGFNLGISQRHFYKNGSFLESLIGYKIYDVSILPKEEGGIFRVTTEGMQGNFFNEQERDSSRVQWSEALTLQPFSKAGSHQIRTGIEFTRSEFSGDVNYSPIEVIRSDGTLAESNEFDGPASIGASGAEFSTFVQDRWQPSNQLTIEPGVRLDYSGLANDWNWSPRVAFSYAPDALPRTAIKGGAGIFYDKIFLNALDFEEIPLRTVTTYDETGNPLSSIVLHPQIEGKLHNPYSTTWNLELDQQMSDTLLLRLNYMMRNGQDQLVVNPEGDQLVLSNDGNSRYHQVEVTARYRLSNESQLFFSYIHSSTMGDLNDFNSYFGNFQQPLIRENDSGFLPFDATHRFLTWGVVKIPGKVFVSPVLELRSGFRYSAVNEDQQFVGERNSLRYPAFAQLDLRVTRTFQVFNKYQVMLGMKVFNILNGFNPRDVQNNIASPSFGTFYNSTGRTVRLAFEIKY